jgi:ribonuclease VapC
MIAVDTSALMAILLEESQAGRCKDILQHEGDVLITAATLTKAMIVARSRDVSDDLTALLDALGCTVVPLSEATARRAAAAHARWGKGNHRAGLNYGDCFAYALAQEQSCPLLYVGNDFARTDVGGAETPT